MGEGVVVVAAVFVIELYFHKAVPLSVDHQHHCNVGSKLTVLLHKTGHPTLIHERVGDVRERGLEGVENVLAVLLLAQLLQLVEL